MPTRKNPMNRVVKPKKPARMGGGDTAQKRYKKKVDRTKLEAFQEDYGISAETYQYHLDDLHRRAAPGVG